MKEKLTSVLVGLVILFVVLFALMSIQAQRTNELVANHLCRDQCDKYLIYTPERTDTAFTLPNPPDIYLSCLKTCDVSYP